MPNDLNRSRDVTAVVVADNDCGWSEMKFDLMNTTEFGVRAAIWLPADLSDTSITPFSFKL